MSDDEAGRPDGAGLRVLVQDQAAAVLRETQQFYVALDQRGVVQGWNRAATRTFGYREDEALGVPLERLIVPEAYRARHLQGIEHFVQTGHGRGVDAPVEVRATRKDGSEVSVELTIWAQDTPSGYVFHALGTDLTERREHERVLRVLAEHRRLLLLLDRPEDVRHLLVETVCQAVDGDGAWLYLVGGQHAAVERVASTGGRAPHLVREDEERLRAALASWVTGQGQQPEELDCPGSGLSLALEPVAADERLVGLLVAGWQVGRRAALPTTTRALLALLAAEAVVVLQRLELQAQLLQASRTDALTGLLNRRAFDEALRAALSTAERGDDQVTLVLIDLDHFKTYNDRHGHPAGDTLLREVTAAWHGVVRPPDVLARIGGDEFALLLPHTAVAHVDRVLARLRAVTGERASFTAGSAAWRSGDDAGRLLQRADADLYEHKRRRA